MNKKITLSIVLTFACLFLFSNESKASCTVYGSEILLTEWDGFVNPNACNGADAPCNIGQQVGKRYGMTSFARNCSDTQVESGACVDRIDFIGNCSGTNGPKYCASYGRRVSCTPTANGTCDNSVQNGCSAGTPNDGAHPDTGTEYRWRCDGAGTPKGTDSGMCSRFKPVTGSCNNATRNACTAGAPNDAAVADTSTHFRWLCDGQYGGASSGTCSLVKPVNGTCDNSTRNGCTVGTPNDAAVADTSTQYMWRCDGQNSGTNSATCSTLKPVAGVCNESRKTVVRRGHPMTVRCLTRLRNTDGAVMGNMVAEIPVRVQRQSQLMVHAIIQYKIHVL